MSKKRTIYSFFKRKENVVQDEEPQPNIQNLMEECPTVEPET